MRRGAALPAAAACLALLLAAAPGARSQPGPRAAGEARRAAEAERHAAEDAARAAATAAAAEDALAEGRVQAARRVQDAEAEAQAAALRTRAAAGAAAAAEAAWQERWAALAPALPAMLRLGLWPAESLLASPAPPDETSSGLLVLQGLSRRLARDAAALRASAAAAKDAAVAAEAEARGFAKAEASARSAASALDTDLREARRRRAAARDAETAAADRAAEAAARSADLDGALARLEREAAEEKRREAQRAAAAAKAKAGRARTGATEQPPAGAPSDAPSGDGDAVASAAPPAVVPRRGRVMPVAGQVLREFGAGGEGGPARGLTLQAPAGGRVVSPCAGRIVFAAPFRSYGRLLIVDCGEGYHFVLGGLERLDVAAAQKVLAGEPVGVLGGAPPGAATADGLGRATLYVELRRRGDPVDPRPWFAARG